MSTSAACQIRPNVSATAASAANRRSSALCPAIAGATTHASNAHRQRAPAQTPSTPALEYCRTSAGWAVPGALSRVECEIMPRR
jgi:hypothetical protein